MRSNTARAIAGLAVVALAIVLFIVFQGGDDDESGDTAPPTAEQPTATGSNGGGDDGQTEEPPSPPPAPPVPTIRIQGDSLAGDVEQIDVSTGETVRFRVVADQPWDLHIHGFDIEDEIRPGQPLEISFPAEIEGTFEAEVHGETAEFPIAEINVSPS